jgi:hypothetical protein
MADDPDEGVGYGKPPRHSRFHKGRSGNPRGRPKGSIGNRAMLVKMGNEKVTIVVNGRRVKRTKLWVARTQMINKAMAGDWHALAAWERMLPDDQKKGAPRVVNFIIEDS